MRPHPSRAVEPTWLSRAQSDFDRKRAAEQDAEHREWMREAEGRRLYREHRDAAIAAKQRQLRDLPAPSRPASRRRGEAVWFAVGFCVLFGALVTGHLWLALAAMLVVGLSVARTCERILHSSPRPRSHRVVQIGPPERERPAPGSHYHGDVLCHCDRPEPCCDQGLLVWPLLCPWHPQDEA